MAEFDHDDPIDDELRAIARAAIAEAEGSVAVEEALAGVRRRGLDPDEVDALALRRGPSRWLVLGAAAAVLGMVAAGIVVGSRDGGDNTVRTNTVAPVTTAAPPPTDVPRSTVLSTLPPVPPTTVEVVPAPESTEPQVIAVDAANPPPLIEPEPFASIPLQPNPNGNSIDVAIGAQVIVVRQPNTSFVTVVAEGRDLVELEIDEPVSGIVAGPGDVIYGLGDPVLDNGAGMPSAFRFIALALAGERAGQVVAVENVGVNEYLELPDGAFGHGPDGVIDRARDVNSMLIGYVDVRGETVQWTGDDPPLLTIERFRDGQPFVPVVSVVGSDLAWTLEITRSPDHSGTYVGPSPPAPTTGGRVIYTEAIGADTTPETDFGPNEMPVIAILEPDGSGSWIRLPDDWSVAASDVWGTVLMRTSNGEIELAMLDEALAAAVVEPVEPAGDVLAIERRCIGDFNCTLLANTLDGRIVAYDPPDNTLTVLDPTGAEILATVPVPIGTPQFPWIETIGPDDVVYFSYTPSDAIDPVRQLIAVPLSGPRAGEAVASWSGLDGSGDTDLVPTTAGLAVVGCCGPDLVRPSPEAELFEWVDQDGEPTTLDGPTFRLELGDNGNELVRIDGRDERRFRLPTVATSPRGMPRIVPTPDGGALMFASNDGLFAGLYVVNFRPDWPSFRVDNGDVFLVRDEFREAYSLLEPGGTLITPVDSQFVRRTLDEIGTRGWTGRLDVDTSGAEWIITAPGLNDYIDTEQPAWAADPLTLAIQLQPSVGPAEVFETTYDPTTGLLTTTVSNFLDDSAHAAQDQITLELGADGLYRFVSGTAAQQCQPGRGHQDFRPEPCI